MPTKRVYKILNQNVDHTSGQLGLGGYSSPYALSEGGEPQLQLFSSPRRVESICSADVQIEAMSAGLDHTIFLTRHRNGSQSLMTCGSTCTPKLKEFY